MPRYDYTVSKKFAEDNGLVWAGDDYAPLLSMDDEAYHSGMRQDQIDIMMRHHLQEIKILFTPKYYKWYQRLALAFYFLTGCKGK